MITVTYTVKTKDLNQAVLDEKLIGRKILSISPSKMEGNTKKGFIVTEHLLIVLEK